MGPEGYSTTTPSSPSNLDSVQKLRDDGSNWSDYQSRMERVLGARGLWRHVVGTAAAPKQYAMVNGIPVMKDGTPATDEEVEAKEDKITEHEKREYLAQHIILSTTSTRLGMKIKGLMSAKGMWDVVKEDATSKTTLFILDAESQLSSMKLQEEEDPETHLLEMKEHFQLMVERHENLLLMGSEISNARFNAMIMSSLPESYRPTLQTITAAKRTSALMSADGTTSKRMKPNDLIAFLLEEAQHRVINNERSRYAEQALAARAIPKAKGKGKPKEEKADDEAPSHESETTCHNCGKTGHTKDDCYSKGGGKEGQAPWQRKGEDKGKQADTAVIASAEDKDKEFFAHSRISEFANIAEETQVPKLRLGAYTKSGSLPVEGDIENNDGTVPVSG